MGENYTMTGRQSKTDKIQQEILYTEREIGDTIHILEQKLSPANLRRQGVRKATHLAVQGTANLLEFAKHKPVQVSLMGTGALLMWMRSRRAHQKPAVSGIVLAGTALKAFLTGARGPAKKGTLNVGKNMVWRGLATALGAVLGTYWYGHRQGRI